MRTEGESCPTRSGRWKPGWASSLSSEREAVLGGEGRGGEGRGGEGRGGEGRGGEGRGGEGRGGEGRGWEGSR